MKKLLKYIKGYRIVALFAPLFKLFEALLELLVPIVMAAIIDTGITNADKPYIYKSCLLLVVLGATGLAFSITAQYFSAKAAVGFATKVRHVMFDHMQHLSFSVIDRLGTASMITRITSDLNQVQTGVNMALRLFLRSPFIVFGAMIMAFTIDWQSALVFAVSIPILFAVVFGIILFTMPMYKRVQGALDQLLRITRDALGGARVIRAFNKQDDERTEFRTKNQEVTARQKHVGKLSALLNPVTYVIINLAIVVLIYIGALQVNGGKISQGEVVALYSYMSQILVELIKLANCIITVSKSCACANRISAVLDLQNDLERIPSAPAKTGMDFIVFDHVDLKYKNGGENALTDICFSVKKGETIGIIGGTGSGKTSLVNLIPHFYDTTGGHVYIDGVDVKALDVEQLRERIGMVMQKAVLFHGTIRENLLWGNPNATPEQLDAALTAAQATDIIKDKEKGLDTMVEQGGRNFSGGQRQRLTIARALVRNPEILILDDSASALDFATDAKLRQVIRQLPGQPTVFIVSQRTASIRHADKILVLDDGVAVGLGTHAELMDNCEVYREIYDSQFKKDGASA